MKCENNQEHCPAATLSGDTITRDGVYRIDANSASDVRVSSGVRAHIFDATSGVVGAHRRIILEEGSEVVICGYIYDAEYDVEIITEGESTSQNVAYLLASTGGAKVKSKISSKIRHHQSIAQTHIVSFVGSE